VRISHGGRICGPRLLVVFSLIFTGFISTNAAADTARLPDLAAYDCATLNARAAYEVRHIGQVIKGRYSEWDAIYTGDQTQLVCLSLLKPRARQLSRDEAKDFLSASLGVGALLASHAPADAVLAGPTADPAAIKPEPLLRLDPRSADTSTDDQPKPADLPPRAALPMTSPAAGIPSVAPQPMTENKPPATMGVDDRTPITATDATPWNTVGYLAIDYPNGEKFRCTATAVSPYVVLTAGHCILNMSRGGYVTQVKFYPGQYQASVSTPPMTPFGVKSDYAYLQTTQAWVDISSKDSYPISEIKNDMGVIGFKTPFTHTDTFMPILFGSTRVPVMNAGYPAYYHDTYSLGLYAQSGPENGDIDYQRANHVRAFTIDASGGNSGGPLLILDPQTNREALVGVLTFGRELDDRAGGPWYDSWDQPLITSWMAWTPDVGWDPGTSGFMHVAAVQPGRMVTAQSYVRFYNPSDTDGTVEVLLLDPDSGFTLGAWRSPTIRSGAELQFSVKDMETAISSALTKPAVYSLVVRPTFQGLFQHVLWQMGQNTLSNLSTCGSNAWNNAPYRLIGVHSSLLNDAYPSTVVIQNTGFRTEAFTIGIYDARDGAKLGNYTTAKINGNGQVSVAVAEMEKAAGITPAGTMYHYVLKSEQTWDAILQHFVKSTTNNAVEDLTAVCSF
jgi:V8-like Glu-specific endopeptidase